MQDRWDHIFQKGLKLDVKCPLVLKFFKTVFQFVFIKIGSTRETHTGTWSSCHLESLFYSPSTRSSQPTTDHYHTLCIQQGLIPGTDSGNKKQSPGACGLKHLRVSGYSYPQPGSALWCIRKPLSNNLIKIFYKGFNSYTTMDCDYWTQEKDTNSPVSLPSPHRHSTHSRDWHSYPTRLSKSQGGTSGSHVGIDWLSQCSHAQRTMILNRNWRWTWRCRPIISATREAKAGRLQVQGPSYRMNLRPTWKPY